MALIKLIFLFLGLVLALTCWPIALIVVIFIGLMKVGMKKDFEP